MCYLLSKGGDIRGALKGDLSRLFIGRGPAWFSCLSGPGAVILLRPGCHLQGRKGQGRVQPPGQEEENSMFEVSQERACLLGRMEGREVGLVGEGGGVGQGGEVT